MKGGIARIIREDDIREAVVNFFVKGVASNVALKAVKDDGEYNKEIVSEKMNIFNKCYCYFKYN